MARKWRLNMSMARLLAFWCGRPSAMANTGSLSTSLTETKKRSRSAGVIARQRSSVGAMGMTGGSGFAGVCSMGPEPITGAGLFNLI